VLLCPRIEPAQKQLSPHAPSVQKVASPASFVFLLALLLAVFYAAPAAAVEMEERLFTVQLPVVDQGQAERHAAAQRGLLQVLTRVTGLLSVPRTTAIAEALAEPQRFYSQFAYVRLPTDAVVKANNNLALKMVFQAKPVYNLVRAAKLPIWWSRRPETLVWIAVEEEGKRRLANPTDWQAFAPDLQARAQARGLPLTQPISDLQDAMAISANAIWGRFVGEISTASARYQASVVLVGRMSRQRVLSDYLYSGDWQLLFEQQAITISFRNEPWQTVASLGVDLTAENLAERSLVFDRGIQQHKIDIVGIEAPEAYAQLMNYLQRIEFIQGVAVNQIADNRLAITVKSTAERDQLLQLLTLEGLLQRQPASGFEMRRPESVEGANTLRWRG